MHLLNPELHLFKRSSRKYFLLLPNVNQIWITITRAHFMWELWNLAYSFLILSNTLQTFSTRLQIVPTPNALLTCVTLETPLKDSDAHKPAAVFFVLLSVWVPLHGVCLLYICVCVRENERVRSWLSPANLIHVSFSPKIRTGIQSLNSREKKRRRGTFHSWDLP